MPIYRAEIQPSANALPTTISLDVEVLRDGIAFSRFIARFSASMPDSDIRAEVERRLRKLVEVDADRIEKVDVLARTIAIADSLKDLSLQNGPAMEVSA
jgi:hypothetical protein